MTDKWAQRFGRLEAILLSKSFAEPVELVKKPAAVVTNEQPFFDPGVGSCMILVTQPAEVFTGASPVQAINDVTATQPGEAPGKRGKRAATRTATWPVEAPGTGRSATQDVKAPGARMATQPVEAPSASSSPVLGLLLIILVCLTQKMRWLINRNPLLQKVTRKFCQTGTQSRKTI